MRRERGRTGNAPAEAAVWLARLHADTRTAADERAFRLWLASDRANTEAFEHVTSVWDMVGAVTTVAQRAATERRPALRRRAVLGCTVAMLTVAVSALMWREADAGIYETAPGEQRHVALPDGSRLLLDTDTRLKVRFDRHSRLVTLLRGRANFCITPDAMRPFRVQVADEHIVVPGGSFDVRKEGERVSLVVLRGQAVVEKEGIASRSQRENVVPTGARLTASPEASVQVDRPDSLAPLIAWQSGRAVFDDESLREAVAEMNRYSAVKLVVTDSRAAALHVSGVYRVGNNRAFARSITTLLPVTVREDSNIIALSSAPQVSLPSR